jgi:sec-independent protein translocase protein TatB
MEFLNVGGGELLIIVLVALILFGPEDIMKMMRTVGKYTRSARDMWTQFSTTIEQEYVASSELSEVIEETKTSVAEAKEVMDSIKTSVGEVSTSVTANVSAAQKTIEKETRESAAAIRKTTRSATQGLAGSLAEPPAPQPDPSLPVDAIATVDTPQPALELEADPEALEAGTDSPAQPTSTETSAADLPEAASATDPGAADDVTADVVTTEVVTTEVVTTDASATDPGAADSVTTEVVTTEVVTTHVVTPDAIATEIVPAIEGTVEPDDAVEPETVANADEPRSEAPERALEIETVPVVEVTAAALEGVNGSDGDRPAHSALEPAANAEDIADLRESRDDGEGDHHAPEVSQADTNAEPVSETTSPEIEEA